MRPRLLVLSYFIAFYSVINSLADMGALPPSIGAISEDEQNAIILFDAKQKRETLVLQTNLSADRDLSSLFFMPLPAAPKVSLAPSTMFEKAVELAKDRKMRYDTGREHTLGGDSKSTDRGMRVLTHEKLGEHDLTVVEVKSLSHFMQWVVQYRADHKLRTDFNFDAVRDLLEAYLNDGLRFFLFDRVELSESEKTMHPLVIEFDSSRIYYPLRVNKLYSGPSDVQLMILSPQRIPQERFTQIGFFATAPDTVEVSELAAVWTGFKSRANGNLHFQCFRLADPRLVFRELYPYATPSYERQKLGLEIQAKRRWEHDVQINFEPGKEFDPSYSIEAWPGL